MKSWLAFAIGGLLAALIVAAIFQAKYSGGEKQVASIALPDQRPSGETPAPPAGQPAEVPPPGGPSPAPVRPMTPPRATVYPPAAPVTPPPSTHTIPPPAPQSNPPAPVVAPATPEQPVTPPSPPPPPPRVARTVTIAEGTIVPVRVMERVSTETNKPGETFPVTLDEALVIDGFVIAEKGARGQAKITAAERAGRVKDVARMAFALDWITSADGQRVSLETSDFLKEGEKETTKDAAKIGIGAAVGAAIGAIAGGGKGAAIGGAAGAGAGTGAVLATRGADVVFNVEDRVSLRVARARKVTEKLK